jgi:predicted short-subunit dehydrogenase-like oxidoreductase (DUF2520 family)
MKPILSKNWEQNHWCMAKKQYHINILGGGHVATHLARQFLNTDDIVLQQMYNRHLDKILEFKNQTELIDDLKQLKPADLNIIAIKDDVISEFSKKLSDTDVLTVHTSGSVPMSALHTQRKGVLYPFQTFSKDKAVDFKQIPILIEANNKEDLKTIETIAKHLSEKVIAADSKQRKALHIAGVFAANFVNHLYVQAEQILKDNDLPFDLLKPLILEVANKVQDLSPTLAQTGPAVRKDFKIIESHLEYLKNANQKNIYKLLTDSIIKSQHYE